MQKDPLRAHRYDTHLLLRPIRPSLRRYSEVKRSRRRQIVFLFFALFFLTVFPNSAHPSPKDSLGSFDLFGLKLSSLKLDLGERAKALGVALAQRFPKTFSGTQFQVNSYSGACFTSGSDNYRMSWRDSETEGFRFSVETLKGEKTCPNPFSEGMVLKIYPLNPAELKPLSNSHPALQLGVSTSAQVKAELGKPDYSDSKTIIYTLVRDRPKEKGCGYEPAKGDFAAIELTLQFVQDKLVGASLANGIAGEC